MSRLLVVVNACEYWSRAATFVFNFEWDLCPWDHLTLIQYYPVLLGYYFQTHDWMAVLLPIFCMDHPFYMIYSISTKPYLTKYMSMNSQSCSLTQSHLFWLTADFKMQLLNKLFIYYGIYLFHYVFHWHYFDFTFN